MAVVALAPAAVLAVDSSLRFHGNGADAPDFDRVKIRIDSPERPADVKGDFTLEFWMRATHAGDGSGRLFVVEQPGRIRIVRDGALVSTPFLDISSLVSCCGERGLLSVAFSPSFGEPANGRLFVNYTNLAGDTVIAGYRVSADPDRADPQSAGILLTIPQPYSNHNGGQLAFGPFIVSGCCPRVT